jgi:uncharacterized protein DUF5677
VRHLTLQDVRLQEIQVEGHTESRLAGFTEYFDRFANILLKLLYATPAVKSAVTDVDQMKSQARHWFHSSIFTFRATVLLSSRGYYLESQILDRSLIEILVKLRYFHKHPDKLVGFQSIAAKRKNGITWKEMFDEVLPGYYVDEYGWSMSYVAHGGVGANVYRTERDAAGNGFGDAGVCYKEFWAGASINQKTVFMLGFLRTYRNIFPEAIGLLSSELRSELSAVEDFLERCVKEHIASKGGSNDWHKAAEPIWTL